MRLRLAEKWDRFFFTPIDPRPLALFRIVFGVFLLMEQVAWLPNWERYFAPGGLRPEVAGWTLFSWSEAWMPALAWWSIALLATVAFTIGWRSRAAAAALFLIHGSMNATNPMSVNGEDLIARMLLFFCVFARTGAALSLGRHPRAERVPAWPLSLMQLNIAAVYFFSLPLKLAADPSWLNGEAMYWVMMSSTWNRWPIREHFYEHGPFFPALLTYSTVLVEGCFPFLVWHRRTRLPILAAIASFHLGLAILLQHVSFFSFSMICSFLLFVPPEWLPRRLRHSCKPVSGRRYELNAKEEIPKWATARPQPGARRRAGARSGPVLNHLPPLPRDGRDNEPAVRLESSGGRSGERSYPRGRDPAGRDRGGFIVPDR